MLTKKALIRNVMICICFICAFCALFLFCTTFPTSVADAEASFNDHTEGETCPYCHAGVLELETTATEHSLVCSRDGYNCFYETGGHAWEWGYCTECGYYCSHEYEYYYEDCSDNTYHNTMCSNCSSSIGELANHKYSNGKCSDCNHVCTHDWEEGTCTICKMNCPHDYVKYETDTYEYHTKICDECSLELETNLPHSYVEGVCDGCSYECLHNKGTYFELDELDKSFHLIKCKICECMINSEPHNYSDGVCTDCSHQCSHDWSDGTCTECHLVCTHSWNPGMCSKCGMPCLHDDTEGVPVDNDHHNVCCTLCREVIIGGVSHDYSEGMCIDCNYTCPHENGVYYVSDDNEYHHYLCNTCNLILEENVTHEYSNGKCSDCNHVCPHNWVEGACTYCHTECEHEENTNYVSDNDQFHHGACSVCNLTLEANITHVYLLDGQCSDCDHVCTHSSTSWVTSPIDHTAQCVYCNTQLGQGNHSFSESVCTTCDYVCQHSDTIPNNDESQHWTECMACGYTFNYENHIFSGSSYCSKCARECNHINSEYRSDESSHWKYCFGCQQTYDTDLHIWNSDLGNCNICTRDCEHDWVGGICDNCQFVCVHANKEVAGQFDEYQHSMTCTTCDCLIVDYEDHNFDNGKCSGCNYLKIYSITYNLDNGLNGANPDTYTVETETITLAGASKDNYTFGGWYSDASFGTKVESIVLGSTGDLGLYAKFTPISYTITYNLDGGSNGANPETYTVETETITLAGASKNGYTFGGWYSDASFGTQVESIVLGSTGDLELFAKFTPITYTITYNLDNGTNGTNPDTYTVETETITLADASKDNYTFGGWYSNASFGTKVESIVIGSTGNLELFAKFTPISYTITYNLDNGTNGANPETYTVETETITLAGASKNGYTFGGWYSDASFGTKVESIVLGSTGNLELFAKFTPITYTVTYNLDNGTNTENPETYTVETAEIMLTGASKNGYTFVGWYSDASFEAKVESIEIGSSGNLELYAKFTPTPYTITYNLDGGANGANPDTYTVETETITLAGASKEGYAFEGWYSDASFETKVESIEIGSSGNLELFAKFTEQKNNGSFPIWLIILIIIIVVIIILVILFLFTPLKKEIQDLWDKIRSKKSKK